MSYVSLKHLLADLTLEAVAKPEGATWAPLTAAYAALATSQRPVVPHEDVHRGALALGRRFGWRPSARDLAFLVRRGLLEQHEDTLTVRASFVPHLSYLARHAPRLLDALWMLHTTETATDLERGVALFNAGLFFECHELLEGVWRGATGPAKNFYHGIVQVAASFYHYEKQNLHGARTLLDKGLQRLGSYPDEYLSIRLGAFRKALSAWMEHLVTGNAARPPVPRIARRG